MPDIWDVLDYEVKMFKDLLALCQGGRRLTFPAPIPNAITESLLLHTRILCDVLLSRGRGDDIKLKTLLPDFSVPEIDTLRILYGKDSKPHSICWTFNKRLAHATTVRADSGGYDYSNELLALKPYIEEVLAAVDKEKSTRGN